MEKGDQVEFDQNVLEKLGVALVKRRSCELVATASPCVKKALFHLKSLQEILAQRSKWVHKANAEGSDIVEFIHSEDKGLNADEQQKEENSHIENAVEQGDDFVAEVGQELGFTKQEEVYKLKSYQEAPKEVFRQVTQLILRLEDDRAKTEKLLDQEQKRLSVLDGKLAKLMVERMTTLPMQVQLQHEACARNIGELDWHVTNSVKKQRTSVSKLEEVQEINFKIRSEINFIQQHSPLVKEKLKIEQVAFEETQEMQNEANYELEKKQSKLNEVVEKYEKNVKKNEIQINLVDLELEAAQRELKSIKEKYSVACMMEKSYKTKSAETECKIEEKEEEYWDLQDDISKCKVEEEKATLEAEQLTDKVNELDSKNKECKKQLDENEKKVLETAQRGSKELEHLDKVYANKTRDLKQVEQINTKLRAELEQLNKEIRETERKIESSKFECERLGREQIKNEEKITNGMEKIELIKQKNAVIRAQIDKEETVAKEIEGNLKAKVEELRRQVDEETNERTKLEKQKSKNLKQLDKTMEDHNEKQEKMEKEFQENDEALQRVATELRVVREQHTEATQTMEALNEQLEEIETEQARVENELSGKKEKLHTVATKLQKEEEELVETLTRMEREQKVLEPQIADMKTSQFAMHNKMKETKDSLNVINEELQEVRTRYDDKQKIIEMLKLQLNGAKERLERRDIDHRQIMRERREVIENLELGNAEGIRFNKKAAESYRRIQELHLELKNDSLALYDEKLMLEASVKDYKQLVEMQQKMNWALNKYYHNRSQFNQAHLLNFKHRTMQNSEAVAGVQKGLEEALHNVENFLQSHVNGSEEDKVIELANRQLKSTQSTPFNTPHHNPFQSSKSPLPPLHSIISTPHL